MSNVCPKCGSHESSELWSPHDGWCGIYGCGSEQNYRRGFCQSNLCRIAELEAALAKSQAEIAALRAAMLALASEFDVTHDQLQRSHPENPLNDLVGL